MKIITISFALLLISTNLFAYCDKYPEISVAQEIERSKFVVIGTVISRMIVVDPLKDPEGYEAEIFKFKIEKTLKGQPGKIISLYNVNSSARFPMEVNKKYFLFVDTDEDGYWVNSCGTSKKYQDSAKVMDEVKRLLQNKMHNQKNAPDQKTVR